MGRKPLGDKPLTNAERQARFQKAPRYVVIVRDKPASARAFGIYRSVHRAGKDAQAWGGSVIEVEPINAEEPWNPHYEE